MASETSPPPDMVNLTPHDVNVWTSDTEFTCIPRSGEVLRTVGVREPSRGSVRVQGAELPTVAKVPQMLDRDAVDLLLKHITGAILVSTIAADAIYARMTEEQNLIKLRVYVPDSSPGSVLYYPDGTTIKGVRRLIAYPTHGEIMASKILNRWQ